MPGTPSELMLVAVMVTTTMPVEPAGRNTLSELFRASAVPPAADTPPAKTLPRYTVPLNVTERSRLLL